MFQKSLVTTGDNIDSIVYKIVKIKLSHTSQLLDYDWKVLGKDMISYKTLGVLEFSMALGISLKTRWVM